MEAVKVAVMAAPCNVSAAPCGMSAAPDTYGNSRGLERPSGGRGVIYMKNCYGIVLLKNLL